MSWLRHLKYLFKSAVNSFLLCTSQSPSPLHFCGCTSNLNFSNFLLVSITFYSQVVGNSTKNYNGQTSKALEFEPGLDAGFFAVQHCCSSDVLHCVRPDLPKALLTAGAQALRVSGRAAEATAERHRKLGFPFPRVFLSLSSSHSLGRSTETCENAGVFFDLQSDSYATWLRTL